MSYLPAYLRLLDELAPASIFDQDFGLGVYNDDLPSRRYPSSSLILMPSRPSYHHHPRSGAVAKSGYSTITNNKNEFQVNLDVQQFKPEEITVKVVDNSVVIDGKHEERQDEHGYISREFKRRYVLPQDVDAAEIKSTMSSDGILSIVAPKKRKADEKSINIPIVQTNQPAVKAEDKKAQIGQGEKMEQ